MGRIPMKATLETEFVATEALHVLAADLFVDDS
jgi:hypothetical protein